MNNLTWCLGDNFGDALNPYLYKKIAGKHPTYVNERDPKSKYVMIGSILNWAQSNDIAWGPGVAWIHDKVVKGVDVRAVRGPLTRKVCIENGVPCPEVYGDPALLMPRYYTPETEKRYKLGIIPHLIDKRAFTCDREDVCVIDICSPIHNVIDRVSECEKIISSSLHGLIIADAYSVPNLWVEFSDKVIGDGTKFNDYFLSVGRGVKEPLDMRRGISLQNVLEYIKQEPFEIDLDKLVDACPFGE